MKKSIIYGLLTALALIIYFLIMKVLGLETNFYLRIFNFVIIVSGVYILLNSIIKSGSNVSYFEGFGAGFRLTLVAVITFLAFMGLYTKFIDPSFVAVLEETGIWGSNISIGQAAFAIFIEGMASGVVISFAWMQYFKKYISSKSSV
ncbi:MAG TPA: DUF4199 domain-containing protein [Cryomorphaceae bacterium]|nr:DUF4199 domain-containing protein [Cryomorphaceae bacterium]